MLVAYGHRGATDLSGRTESIARARRGLGCLGRGLAVLGERRSEVGASNAIEYLPLPGRDGRPALG